MFVQEEEEDGDEDEEKKSGWFGRRKKSGAATTKMARRRFAHTLVTDRSTRARALRRASISLCARAFLPPSAFLDKNVSFSRVSAFVPVKSDA